MIKLTPALFGKTGVVHFIRHVREWVKPSETACQGQVIFNDRSGPQATVQSQQPHHHPPSRHPERSRGVS